MEHREQGPPPFIRIGQIEADRISEDLGWLYKEAETEIKHQFVGRPVPPGLVYKEVRKPFKEDMARFPFFEQAELASRLVSLELQPQRRYVDVDDVNLLTPYGVDFRFSACFAISVVSRSLEQQGFEYNADNHPWRSAFVEEITEQISQSFPVEFRNDIQRQPPGIRLMDEADADNLATMILGVAGDRFKRDKSSWDPLLAGHRQLFTQADDGGDYYAACGIGFGLILMDGLKPAIEDNYVNSFRLNLAELDHKDFKDIIDSIE